MGTGRVAFLVLAHHQPAHLARLVGALDDPGTHVFIHVDARVDPAPFVHAVGGHPRVTLLDRRVAVFWGGFSLVQATLNALDAARRAGPFARHCLLSGADFPIQPRATLLARLRAPDVEWLRVGVDLGAPDAAAHRRRIERWHWNDVAWLNPRVLPAGAVARRTRRVARAAAGAVQALLPPRRFPCALAPYKGSQWWALSDACVDWMLRFVDEHPAYLRFHRHVDCADEVFFHTLVKASPFAGRISHDLGPVAANVYGTHWVAWHDGQPRVLDERDLPALRASDALFARKFDETRSRALLDRLSEEVARG